MSHFGDSHSWRPTPTFIKGNCSAVIQRMTTPNVCMSFVATPGCHCSFSVALNPLAPHCSFLQTSKSLHRGHSWASLSVLS